MNMNTMYSFVVRNRLEVSIFAIALLVRLALVCYYLAYGAGSLNWGADGGDYANEALNILNGHGFSRSWEPPYLPDAIRTPLYPLFLAIVYGVFGTWAVVPVIEAFLSSALPVLFVRMAKLFVRDTRILLAGALFLSVEPHLVFNTIFFGSEGVSILLLMWGLFELLKMAYDKRPPVRPNGHSGGREASLRAGFALGLATLARPITTYLPIFLLPLVLYQGWFTRASRTTLKLFGLFVLVFFITISPWLLRNYTVFGTAGMGTVGWFNVYTRLAATVQAIDTGDDFYTSYHKLLDELSLRGYVTHPPPVSEYEIQDPRFADVLKDESLRVIGEHKKALVIYLATYPFSVLTQDNTLGYLGYFGLTEVVRPPFSPTLYFAQHGPLKTIQAVAPYLAGAYIVPYFMRALFLLLAVFALAGGWLLFRRGERYAALLMVGFVAYIILMSLNAGAQIDGRYRSQFILIETVLAGVAAERLLRRARSMMVA